jgi:hypothetical protein
VEEIVEQYSRHRSLGAYLVETEMLLFRLNAAVKMAGTIREEFENFSLMNHTFVKLSIVKQM